MSRVAVADVRRPTGSTLIVCVAVLAAVVTLLTLGLRGEPPARNRAELAHQIASGLRCPVCEDLSAADSPAPLAGQMRVQIREKLANGETPDEIRDGFIAAYGTSVLMTPPRDGIFGLVYLFPLLALGVALTAGGLLLRRSLRRPEAGEPGMGVAALTPAERLRVEKALDELRRHER